MLAHLLRRATAETFRSRLGGFDLSRRCRRSSRARPPSRPASWCPAAELLRRVGPVPGLAKLLERLGIDGADSPGLAASGLEFALEGLHLTRRLSKDELPGRTVYGG